MKTSDYSYHLPVERIAQRPLSNRDECRLLQLDRHTGAITHCRFKELIRFLKPGDRLVFNDTKVLPARIWCVKDTGASIEFLFVKPLTNDCWEALVRPLKRVKVGTVLTLGQDSSTTLIIDSIIGNGAVGVKLCHSSALQSIIDVLHHFGEMPLPHYIKRPPESYDQNDYQTVYAKNEGAVAAPTAGLHFTPELLAELDRRGIEHSFITLHVGIGTFRPVAVENPHDHIMHSEQFVLSGEAAAEIMETRRRGGRIVAVGTTVVRVLEHCAVHAQSTLTAAYGSTNIFILPGYTFSVVDALITNFHLPQSTLLMLVSAFANRESVLNAYGQAIEQQYRFYSYGDAMLII